MKFTLTCCLLVAVFAYCDAAEPEELTDASFEENVLGSDIPVLVYFWTPWCGPCRTEGPVVDEIAEEYDGQIKVYKLNAEKTPNTASQYRIRGIPTLMMFKGGERVHTDVGALPKSHLKLIVKSFIL